MSVRSRGAGRWPVVLLSLALLPAVSIFAQQGEAATPDVVRLADELSGKVAEIRGLSFRKPVVVEEIDDAQAREYMSARISKFLGPGQIAALEQLYGILGLIPKDTSLMETLLDVMREQAGGFYDPDSESFYVLDDIPAAVAPIVVVHELTHALEDQHFQLDERLLRDREDDDRLLADSAVHEGTATLVMMLYTARAVAEGEIDASAARVMAASEMGRAEALSGLPDVLRRQLLAPYMLGAPFVAKGDLANALADGFPVKAANRLYRDPPTSTEQILHPAKYWEGGRDEPQPVDLGDAYKALGKRWRLHAEGTLGELTLGSLVGATTPEAGDDALRGEAWTNDAVAGWGGDRWELWRTGSATVVLLGTLWDSEKDAVEFADALPDDPRLLSRVSGNAVAIIAGDIPGRQDRAMERMLVAMGAAPVETGETE